MSDRPSRIECKSGASLGRRRFVAAAALTGLAGCRTLRMPPPEPEPVCASLSAFSAASGIGGVPRCWTPQVLRRDLPTTRYELVTGEGRTVLHSISDGATSGLRRDLDLDPEETPWLHWSWRTDSVDPRATVAFDELDDSPARLIVAFDGDDSLLASSDRLFREVVEMITGTSVPFATLMYVWDGQAPRESVFQYPRTSRIRYLVVESGTANAGRWVGYSRNVVEDYRRVFGGSPGRIRAVAVLTDSDDLKTHSEAWYGDIEFKRTPD